MPAVRGNVGSGGWPHSPINLCLEEGEAAALGAMNRLMQCKQESRTLVYATGSAGCIAHPLHWTTPPCTLRGHTFRAIPHNMLCSPPGGACPQWLRRMQHRGLQAAAGSFCDVVIQGQHSCARVHASGAGTRLE